MKRLFLALVTACACILQIPCFASGEIAGHIYSTDIVAYINGILVNSYNIGGKTAVVVEELLDFSKTSYGFDGSYDDSKRLLSFYTTGYSGWGNSEIPASNIVSGKIVGNIYNTDIKVDLNGEEVKGYNIGGKTAVTIEDIATIDPSHPNSEYGFSKYLCNFIYDNEKREIYLNTYTADFLTTGVAKTSKLQFKLRDNVLTYEFDQINNYGNPLWFDFSEDFALKEQNLIMPLYMDGEVIGDMHIAYNETPNLRYDEEKIKKVIDKTEIVLSFEEAQEYIKSNFNVKNVEEDENALIYIAEKDNINYCLLAMKQGGFTNFYSSGEYTVFELRKDNEYGNCLYCYPTAGPPGSGLVGMTIPVDTGYYLK